MAKEPTRRGGLGRGLAALIPSGEEGRTKTGGLGDGAADVVLGGAKGARGTNDNKKQGAPSIPGAPAMRSPQPPKTPKAPKAATAARAPKVGQPAQAPQEAQAHDEAATIGATYQEIPLGKITPNAKQPRQVFDEEGLAELVHSIREFGLLQPIVVRPAKKGFELIMGERRWRAATEAGLETIPAIVRETADGDMLRDALLENIHRVQLNPLEEAAAYQQLLEEFDVTQDELAQRLGRSRPVITNMIRLLKLPVPVQRRVAAGVLSSGHARALLGLKLGDDAIEGLADRVIAEGLSVRATEEAVTLLNANGEQGAKPRREPAPQPAFLTRAAERLSDSFDTNVSVSMGKRKGKIVVEFSDQDDFERIMDLIEGGK